MPVRRLREAFRRPAWRGHLRLVARACQHEVRISPARFRNVYFRAGGRCSAIVKALALGAKAVMIGRATLYGTTVAGHAGAARAIEIYRDEIDRLLALIGCPGVGALGREYLATSPAEGTGGGEARTGVPRA